MDDDGFIRSNPSVTVETAPVILKKWPWTAGNGVIYTKTDCQCLEHPHVADVILALEKLDVYDWQTSKDRGNNLTIMVPESHRDLFDTHQITIDRLVLPKNTQNSPDRHV